MVTWDNTDDIDVNGTVHTKSTLCYSNVYVPERALRVFFTRCRYFRECITKTRSPNLQLVQVSCGLLYTTYKTSIHNIFQTNWQKSNGLIFFLLSTELYWSPPILLPLDFLGDTIMPVDSPSETHYLQWSLFSAVQFSTVLNHNAILFNNTSTMLHR